MINLDPDAHKAFNELDIPFNNFTSLTIYEIFELGYLAAWHDREGEWEDGYKHGYDEGRYKSIEEGF